VLAAKKKALAVVTAAPTTVSREVPAEKNGDAAQYAYPGFFFGKHF
jgi:hypothetical protein